MESMGEKCKDIPDLKKQERRKAAGFLQQHDRQCLCNHTDCQKGETKVTYLIIFVLNHRNQTAGSQTVHVQTKKLFVFDLRD